MRAASSIVFVATFAGAFCASSLARATITCGDNQNCSNAGASWEVTNSTGAEGIFGQAPFGDGVRGSGETGVRGIATAAYGVAGDATTPTEIGVYGSNTSTGTGNNTAIRGDSTNGTGVLGTSNNSSSPAVLGEAQGGYGVQGTSATGAGVSGSSSAGPGVSGVSVAAGQPGVYGVYFNSTGVGYGVYGQSGSSAGYAGYFNGNVAYTGSLNHVSDSRLKKNIQPLVGGLDQLLKLHGVTFEWKDPDTHSGPGTQWGFIAQDVEKVFPNWVKMDAKGFKMVDTTGVDALVVESMRTLKAKNDKVEADNATLQKQLAKLGDRLSVLEGKRKPLSASLGSEGAGFFGLGVAAATLTLTRRKRTKPTS